MNASICNKKKIFSVLVMITIFYVIFSKIDVDQFIAHFMNMDTRYLVIAFVLFFPQLILLGYRNMLLVRSDLNISFKESFELTLVGNSFNIFTPSKLGDLVKYYFLNKKYRFPRSSGFCAFALEKLLDVLSITLFSAIGFFFIATDIESYKIVMMFMGIVFFGALFVYIFPLERTKLFKSVISSVINKSRVCTGINGIFKYIDYFRGRPLFFIWICLVSVSVWFMNLLQMYVFFLAFNSTVPVEVVFTLVPIAMIIGMIPVTISGMGTRDAALIMLFSGYVGAALMAAVGMMMSFRYFFLAGLGAPYVKKYLEK
ncbi:MAG: flippase-like domain-containing protein [Candidatus Aenigmarchaeota archaeon]|nr:flippase-like domain-containing protein [Candidatus Aenigmarchaeota archaeon]